MREEPAKYEYHENKIHILFMTDAL